MKKILQNSLLLGLLIAVSPLSAESTNPVLIEGEKPCYPEVARSQGIEGTVVIEALVDEKGNVFAADVIESVNPQLDAATVAAVQNWKFTAATEDGNSVMKVVRIPVDFNLVDPIEEALPAEALASK